jgi:hypothetical protein
MIQKFKEIQMLSFDRKHVMLCMTRRVVETVAVVETVLVVLVVVVKKEHIA